MKSFNDSHMHFVGIGINKIKYIDLSKCSNYGDIKKQYLLSDSLISRGWHEDNFEEKVVFAKDLLNEVSVDEPVVSIRTCGHVLICNDKMMEIAGINQDTPQVEGGTFDYETGLFTENALSLIYDHMPLPSKEEIKSYMIAANEELLKNGVTSCGSDDFSTLSVEYELIIECYKELYEEGLIDVRILQQVNIPNYNELNKFIEKGYHKLKFGKFKMGPLKLLADGSLGGRTALLREPYSDDVNNVGVEVFTQDELNELIYLADSNGMDVAIHAIGDKCIDMVIDGISSSLKKTKRLNHRHSIIHSQLANKAQIKRMRDLNIGAQTQPIFLNSDIPIIESRLGERSKETYLFNTMIKEGVITTISTDCPVEPLNPFHNLYCAVTRKSVKNKDVEAFLKEEKMSRSDAIKAYTETPYYFSYDENKNFNDYLVLSKDINTCTDEELLDVEVLETYIDGKLVYKK